MSNLTLQLVMKGQQTVTGPMAAVLKGSKALGKQLGEQNKAVSRVNRTLSDISAYDKLATAHDGLGRDLTRAEQKLARYQRAIDRSDGSNKKLNRGYQRAQRELDSVGRKYDKSRIKVGNFSDALKRQGVNTRNLLGEQRRLTAELEQSSRAADTLRNRYRLLAQGKARVETIRGAAGNVANNGRSLAYQGLAAGAGATYLFKTQLLDTAAEFEDFEAILKTVEGSADKARQSMSWVSDFAAKTPFELAEVTEAFVQLRNYGMDPTNGLLKTLGDTSAAMKKPVLQAVEAIADAVTGENERLKEFGIRASVSKGETTYSYTDRNNQQQSRTVSSDDRAAIQATLSTIWNDKYAGAMEERSRTWRGMVSNMSDQWTRFTNMVMGAGLFDWMKGKLGGLLQTIDRMAADGSLQRVAADWGTKLTGFATGVWSAGEAVGNLIGTVSGAVGGVENLVYLLAGIQLAPLISSVVSLGVALGPVGWALTGIAATVAGITYAFKNWDKIAAWFKENFGAADSFNGGGNARKRQRQNIGVTRPAASAAGGGTSNSTVIENGAIQVNAAPGQDPTAVAEAVMAALNTRDQVQRRSRKSRMSED